LEPNIVNVLLVHAHPEPASFNGALTEVAVRTLTEDGHDVVVSDLYAMGFQPVAGPQEFGDRLDEDHFRLDREQTHAHQKGTTASDVLAEQNRLTAADLLILQFPMWWFGPPAILKGWFDRVLTRGFAYLPGHKYDTGHLRGKLAIVSVTTGTSADTYASDGIDGAAHDILWPIHNGVLRYTGFDVAEPFLTHMPARLTDAERAARLDHWGTALRDLDNRPRLFFHPRSDYDDRERLLPGIEPASGFQHRSRHR
jgi:NAD(P)H dehydrogenase (quinone)